jgi:hypothetical protein
MLTVRIAHNLRNGFVIFSAGSATESIKANAPYECIIVDRTLVVSPCPSGNKHGRDMTGSDRDPEIFGGDDFCLTVHASDPNIACFMVDEAEVHVGPRGTMTWEIPMDHELPWPQIIKKVWSEDAMAEQLYKRLMSASLAGVSLKGIVAQVPAKAKEFIPPARWSSIINEVISS